MDIDAPVTELEFKQQAGSEPSKTYADFAFVVEDMSYEDAEMLMSEILTFVELYHMKMGGGFRMTTDADYIPTEEATNV
jgi:hypothetical protein